MATENCYYKRFLKAKLITSSSFATFSAKNVNLAEISTCDFFFQK